MALPKGFRNNIRLTSPNIGVPRRQELLDNIADDGTFLPRGVLYQDMDETFIEFINKELNIEIDGNQVPVIFLTLQRYSEFTKTWQFTDEYKNIKIPFITIVRKPDVQVGTNYNGLYNVPGRPTFTYYKVPTNDGARVGIDLYKVPQPTSVDITYEVRLFTNKMSDLNLLNEKIQKKFQSRQAYIWPKGHPMPVMLESIGDESNIDDFENRRFYVQPFEMLLAGYILDENDFEIIPTINRAMVMSEIELADGVTTPITDPKKGGGCIVATQGSVIVRNTNNTVLSVVSCGENYVVGNSLIFNSGNTYSQLVPATTSFQLPNETIEFVNTTGGTTSFTFPVYSNPIFSANTFCLPVNVTNSGSTYDVWVASGDDLELPNITHIDSNLSPVTLPAQTPFVATTCPNIEIGVYSDSGFTNPITTPTYSQTVYVKAVPILGLVPVEYSFFAITDDGNTITLIVTTSNDNTSFVAAELPAGANTIYVVAIDSDSNYFVDGTSIIIPPPPLWFNVYPNPLFGISTMKLSDSFVSPQIRVRENIIEDDFVVNATSGDIPFIDLTAIGNSSTDLASFLNGNDGFVQSLYDQSQVLNPSDGEQVTSSAQPQIAEAGVLYPLFSTRNAFKFDGINDFLSVCNGGLLPLQRWRDLSETFSVVAIVKPLAVSGGLIDGVISAYTIMGMTQQASFPNGQYIPFNFGITNSTLHCGFRARFYSTNRNLYSTAIIIEDEVYTVGITKNGTTVKFYINGILDSTQSLPNEVRNIGNNNAYVTVGASRGSSANNTARSLFNGYMDSVVLTDEVYSDAEMLYIHNTYGVAP